jgi:phage gpG-like protein
MARKLFQTKVSHARFVVGAFSSDEMNTLATILRDSMRDRIQRSLNVDDQPARPLTPKYAKRKEAKGKNPVRDWNLSGNTLRSMAVLSANENRAVIGFNNPIAGRIAHWNNLRERAFGVSPRDRQTLVAAVRATARQARVITVRQAA